MAQNNKNKENLQLNSNLRYSGDKTLFTTNSVAKARLK